MLKYTIPETVTKKRTKTTKPTKVSEKKTSKNKESE